jgi:putative transposase
MVRAYSMDLRRRALDRLASGATSREVAATLQVAVSSVLKWAQRERQTGSAAPGKVGGHRPFLIAGEHRDWVLLQIETKPHVTLAELTSGLAERGLKIHPASVGRLLHREGKSFKKNHVSHRAAAPEAGAPAPTMAALSDQD